MVNIWRGKMVNIWHWLWFVGQPVEYRYFPTDEGVKLTKSLDFFRKDECDFYTLLHLKRFNKTGRDKGEIQKGLEPFYTGKETRESVRQLLKTRLIRAEENGERPASQRESSRMFYYVTCVFEGRRQLVGPYKDEWSAQQAGAEKFPGDFQVVAFDTSQLSEASRRLKGRLIDKAGLLTRQGRIKGKFKRGLSHFTLGLKK